MIRRPGDNLLGLVESFFRDYLHKTRAASRHTVLAYRDSLRLFFCYLSDATSRDVADLRVEDLAVSHVIDFLDHLEKQVSARRNTSRGCGIACHLGEGGLRAS